MKACWPFLISKKNIGMRTTEFSVVLAPDFVRDNKNEIVLQEAITTSDPGKLDMIRRTLITNLKGDIPTVTAFYRVRHIKKEVVEEGSGNLIESETGRLIVFKEGLLFEGNLMDEYSSGKMKLFIEDFDRLHDVCVENYREYYNSNDKIVFFKSEEFSIDASDNKTPAKVSMPDLNKSSLSNTSPKDTSSKTDNDEKKNPEHGDQEQPGDSYRSNNDRIWTMGRSSGDANSDGPEKEKKLKAIILIILIILLLILVINAASLLLQFQNLKNSNSL